MDSDDNMEEENSVLESSEAYIVGHSRPLTKDEELVMDKSAYRLYHQLDVESASLSFDILLDNLGYERKSEPGGDPLTLTCIAGTQASNKTTNKLVLMKLNNMLPSRKQISANEENEDQEDSDSEDEDLDTLPEVEAATIPHSGTVNRIRAHQYGGKYYAASWSELGSVHIWDLSRPLAAVNDSLVLAEYTKNDEVPFPVKSFSGHKTEGYAVAWSPASGAEGYLATGDCNGGIHLWIPNQSNWSISANVLKDHSNSVEDIQWSPTEPTVFVSSSSDGDIRVWDTRAPQSGSTSVSSQLCLKNAHNGSDVNVIAWSGLQSAVLLSGGDNGTVRVWDLRLVGKHCAPEGAVFATTKNGPIPCFSHNFDFHKKPITSVEWHPTESNIFMVTSEDDQVSLWDLSLEQDATDQTEEKNSDGIDKSEKLPVQLLFVHAGQHEIKEGHWHPQIPGLVMTTALDGFNIFRTINV